MNRQGKMLVSLIVALALSVAVAGADCTLGTPVNLGPLVNSAGAEGSPKVSADGLELYLSSDRPGGFGGADIMVATRPTRESAWGQAKNLGPVVNTSASETAPTISSDGLELYFVDYRAPRPGGVGKSDIWVTTRPSKDGAWGPPVNLGPLVNGPAEEITPEISPDGLELYFESDRPGGLGSDDIWAARRPTKSDPWRPAVWLGPTINTSATEHCPNLTSDGLTMFFDSTPAGAAAGDLMVTTRATLSSDWGKPVNLGHTASDHFASSISTDGTTLYFASARPGGSGGNDIWLMPVLLGSSAPR